MSERVHAQKPNVTSTSAPPAKMIELVEDCTPTDDVDGDVAPIAEDIAETVAAAVGATPEDGGVSTSDDDACVVCYSPDHVYAMADG